MYGSLINTSRSRVHLWLSPARLNESWVILSQFDSCLFGCDFRSEFMCTFFLYKEINKGKFMYKSGFYYDGSKNLLSHCIDVISHHHSWAFEIPLCWSQGTIENHEKWIFLPAYKNLAIFCLQSFFVTVKYSQKHIFVKPGAPGLEQWLGVLTRNRDSPGTSLCATKSRSYISYRTFSDMIMLPFSMMHFAKTLNTIFFEGWGGNERLRKRYIGRSYFYFHVNGSIVLLPKKSTLR